MKVLVVGGDGMLGHQLLTGLSGAHEVRATLRHDLDHYVHLGLFHEGTAYGGIDVRNTDNLFEVLGDWRPQAIVNAAGIVKQRAAGKDALKNIEVNALFPHRLAILAGAFGCRLVHVSTDCVFSGRRGGYRETDIPDPVDVYGRAKLLGEVDTDECITLRTSIIGLELGRRQGLIEWALSQTGPIPGYRRALYSGMTTMELTRVVDALLTRHPGLSGVWHVASRPISKYQLLYELLERRLSLPGVEVAPDDDFVCDRTLCGDAFEEATHYSPASWKSMLDELAEKIRDREAGVR